MEAYNVKYEVFSKKGCKSKFIVIGDLHGWIGNEQIARVVNNIKDQNPDVIMIAGDIFNSGDSWLDSSSLAQLEHLLESLKESGADVVTILGNHDTHNVDEQFLKNYQGLERLSNVYPLFNSSVDINRNGESIHISGLVTDSRDTVTAYNNKIAMQNGVDQRPQRIIRTLEPILDLSPSQINILLAHDPRQIRMEEVQQATSIFDARIAAHIHNGYLPLRKTMTDKKFVDQDWQHYLYLGIPKLLKRNFARGVVYGNGTFYVLCTQTNDYFLVKYNEIIDDIVYSEISIEEANDIINKYNLTPTIITGGVNRYVGLPIEGSEVTTLHLKHR